MRTCSQRGPEKETKEYPPPERSPEPKERKLFAVATVVVVVAGKGRRVMKRMNGVVVDAKSER